VDRSDRLSGLYAAFNARDIDAVLAGMDARVDWPNAWEGGRVVGHEAVRDYWTRQWAAIDPRVEPESFTALSDGRVAVDVHQVVRGLDGAVIAEGRVRHVYVFAGDLVARMDLEEAAAEA
jgi:hypothetical protein